MRICHLRFMCRTIAGEKTNGQTFFDAVIHIFRNIPLPVAAFSFSKEKANDGRDPRTVLAVHRLGRSSLLRLSVGRSELSVGDRRFMLKRPLGKALATTDNSGNVDRTARLSWQPSAGQG
jgi:hypothetical protein